MILARLLFAFILAAMLAITGWASLQLPLLATPRAVVVHPWFLATLVDAYAGFITFFAWVWYKEMAPSGRLAWFIAIMLLGNIAMAAYCLAELLQVPASAELPEVLLRRHARRGILGPLLAGVGIAVVALAAARS